MIAGEKGVLAMNILEHIPYGHENAISRDELARRVGLGDRGMRRQILAARREGNVILNMQDGAGYYQSDDLVHLRSQYRQNESRAKAILAQQEHLKRLIAKREREQEGSLFEEDKPCKTND